MGPIDPSVSDRGGWMPSGPAPGNVVRIQLSWTVPRLADSAEMVRKTGSPVRNIGQAQPAARIHSMPCPWPSRTARGFSNSTT